MFGALIFLRCERENRRFRGESYSGCAGLWKEANTASRGEALEERSQRKGLLSSVVLFNEFEPVFSVLSETPGSHIGNLGESAKFSGAGAGYIEKHLLRGD